jgi:hypothetical protein
MERRAFLHKLGWSSLLFGAAPLRAFALPQISALDDFDPYVIDLNHQHIQGLLQTNSLPSMIRIDSISQTPSRQSWVKGEGLQGVDYAFDNALQRHNQRNMYYASSKCYTPATLLKTNTHPIFGQFFLNESEPFALVVLKVLIMPITLYIRVLGASSRMPIAVTGCLRKIMKRFGVPNVVKRTFDKYFKNIAIILM